jgi:hypothetical protein
MYFNPHGTRNLPRATKAYNRLDSVARHYEPRRMPIGARGKFQKDDQHAKGVQDYLADAFIEAHQSKRKGRYQPRQIARNFFR